MRVFSYFCDEICRFLNSKTKRFKLKFNGTIPSEKDTKYAIEIKNNAKPKPQICHPNQIANIAIPTTRIHIYAVLWYLWEF